MKGKIIFQSILMIVGGAILVINFGWWLILGLILFMWGNNIQMDDNWRSKMTIGVKKNEVE